MSVRLRCASSVYTDGREKPILFWTVKTERVYNIFSKPKKSIKKATSYRIKLSGIIKKKCLINEILIQN